MDWVRTFYSKQHQWANVYGGEVDSWHRDRAKTIMLPDREGPYRILELGCGGGQMTAALADGGHSVTAIDLNSTAIRHAHCLASARPDAQIKLIEGDFYSFSLGQGGDPQRAFDIVCYFDGFGIGSDVDQRRLLGRVTSWLAGDGRAFIEIYTPWYWEQVAGTTMEWPDASRRYGFDTDGRRMLDTWWPPGHPAEAVTQSLRCYSPEDLELLLEGTGLELIDVFPGGAVDSQTGVFRPQVPLGKTMMYMATLARK